MFFKGSKILYPKAKEHYVYEEIGGYDRLTMDSQTVSNVNQFVCSYDIKKALQNVSQ
jgi:hypothetical protein